MVVSKPALVPGSRLGPVFFATRRALDAGTTGTGDCADTRNAAAATSAVAITEVVRPIQSSARLNKGAIESCLVYMTLYLSLIHISEPTRLLSISYAVFCLKKKK